MSQFAQTSLTRLEDVVGGEHLLTDPAEIFTRQVDGMRPWAVVRPGDAEQIADVVRAAVAEKLALIPCGGGTKLGIGSPPMQYDIALDLTRMNRVLAYDPRDLTLGVEPGARIEDLSRVLAEQKQFLPLAVPFSDRATIGGIVAANSSSPWRHSYGAVRDFCLGMEFVTGEGKRAKSGGRVVKNVTGYDLHKLLIGSLGTLAVITRVNFRTFPLLANHGTFVACFSGAEAAFGFCGAIAHSILTPQAVEVVDPGAARLLFSAQTSPRIILQQWSVMITAAGQPAVVDRHARELGRMASTARANEFVRCSDEEHSSVWACIREFPNQVLEASPFAMIFRINVLPTGMAPLLTRLAHLAAQNHLDFAALTGAAGIVYAAFLPEEGEAAPFANLVKTSGEVFHTCHHPEINAQAMLEWAPVDVKRSLGGVWGPARQDFAMMQRVKNAFDPQSVLSPGRFAGGI